MEPAPGNALTQSLIRIPSLRDLIDRHVSPEQLACVETALETALLASLHQNEGRNLRFALVVEAQPLRSLDIQRFHRPIGLTAKQLQSISAAFNPDRTGFVVAPARGQGPVIVGTIARPSAPLPPPQLHRPALVIEAEAPGVLSVSIGEAKAVYRRGEVREQSRTIPGLALEAETELLIREVCRPRLQLERICLPGDQGLTPIPASSWAEQHKDIAAIVRRSSRRIYDRILQRIARRMVRSRRGGAILVLPAGNSTDGLFAGGRWYEQPDRRLLRDVVRILSLEAVHRLTGMGRSLSAEPGLSSPEELASWANDRLRSALAVLEESCAFCADLTEADGAAILRSDLGIEGFSVKLSSHQGEWPSALARFLETRGNRHRAMAGAVVRQSGAIGLVVSQDGDVTVFTHGPQRGPCAVEIVL
ncbi:MAG: putative sensor domain DACNV-containing protein [Cyanobacteria bacterium J06638_7]